MRTIPVMLTAARDAFNRRRRRLNRNNLSLSVILLGTRFTLLNLDRSIVRLKLVAAV
jgi:hypothetical protein